MKDPRSKADPCRRAGGRVVVRTLRLACAAAVPLLLAVAPPVWSSGLTVGPSFAQEGSYGMEVDVSSICATSEDVVVGSQTVTGTLTVEACDTISAGTGFTVSGTGDVTFSAGLRVALGNGFSVQQEGTFAAGTNAGLSGRAYVRDDSPASETSYQVELWVDAGALAMGASDELEHLVAYDAAGTPHLRVLLLDGPAVALEVVDGSDVAHRSTSIPLGAGWHELALDWTASAAATVSITVDGTSTQQVTGVDTSSRRVDFVRWGSVEGTMAGISGALLLDDFVSWR